MAEHTSGTELVTTYLAWVGMFATRALLIMFLAAAVAKRFDVFVGMGFMEALAWSGGYGLLRGLWTKNEEPGK